MKMTQSNIVGDSIYFGIDPTAPDLHVGHLAGLWYLKHWQGNVIIVMGDRTAAIGDPTGKTARRAALSYEQIEHNSGQLTRSIQRLLPNALILYNSMFAKPDFSEISANKLLSLESVKSRKGTDFPVSELLYPCYQAADWLYLALRYDCFNQLGGADQWGNIIMGVELCQKHGFDVTGVTYPLITDKAGNKLGKTSGGAVGLSDRKQFYDFWRRLPDSMVTEIIAMSPNAPDVQGREAQIYLADEMDNWVYRLGIKE